MASLDVQGGHGRRRPVDSQVPLVPFIDLLLCCVMFLLVTAVWNQLAAHDATMTSNTPDGLATPDTQRLTLLIREDAYALTMGVGDSIEIPLEDGEPDVTALDTQLRAHRKAFPANEALTISADDGVAYHHVIQAMDLARGAGFESLVMGGS